jgi:hypothetical protein
MTMILNIFRKHIKEIFILSQFIVFGQNLSLSQSITFNSSIIFKDTIHDESASQVLEVDSGYILSGVSDYVHHRLIIARLNGTGQFIWKRTYGTLSTTFRPGYYDSMIRTGDENIAMAVTYTDTLNTPASRIMIMKFNIDGDTLWSKIVYYPVTVNRPCYAHGIIETNDKGFLVFGAEDYMGVMIKTDSLGIQEWLKYYGPNAYADCRFIFSVCQTSDSGFIVGGHRENIGNSISGNPFVIRYDKSGSVKWEKGFGWDYKDSPGTFIQPVNDSIFMVTANITTSTSGPPYYQPLTTDIQRIKIKDNGEVLFNEFTGLDGLKPDVHDLNVMHDGTFIATGITSNYQSWILNFTADNNIMFFRRMDIPSSNPEYISQLRDITSCSDGGILACGEFKVFGASNPYRPWLIKTDRFGCIDMGCDSTGLYITDQPEPNMNCRNSIASIGLVAQSIQGDIGFNWQLLRAGTWQDIEDEVIYQGFNDDTLIINGRFIENQQESYRCKVYNDFWSLYCDSVVVDFLDTLVIVSDPLSQSVHFGEPADFQVSTSGSQPVDFQWYHDDEIMEGENDSVLFIASVTESDSGSYFCRMTNECGNLESGHAFLRIINLGIEDHPGKDLINIFPNPSEGVLNVRLKSDASIKDIVLSDPFGRRLTFKMVESGRSSCQINISGISPGIYFLLIFTDREKTVRRIIKF